MRPLRPTSTRSVGASLRDWGRDRHGGVAVTVAVMILVLVGVLALSIDVGRIYNASTERNNAADAAAIAAATQLDGQPGACLRAIQAATHVRLPNEETFVSNRTGTNVYISDITNPVTGNPNIQFLSDLVHDAGGNVIGTYITDPARCDEEAVYVEVVTNQVAAEECDKDTRVGCAKVDLYFAGVTGALTEAFPKGYAVARSHELFCAEVPLFMCPLVDDMYAPDAAAQFWTEIKTYQHTGKGVWLKKEHNSDQYLPGNFGFLRLSNAGAFELGEQMGKVNPPLNCVGTGEITTEPGAKESVAKAFNSRLGIFHNGSMADPASPDWQPSADTIKGLVRGSSLQCDISDTGHHEPPTPYTGNNYGGDPDGQAPFVGAITLPGDTVTAMPLPHDINSYNGGAGCVAGRMCDGSWQADVYFAMNHPTLAASYTVDDLLDPTSPVHGTGTNVVDIPWNGSGDGEISRYEMYLWELDRPMQLIPHPDPDLAAEGVQIYVPNELAGGSWNSVGPHHRLVDNTGGPNGPEGYPQVGEYAGGMDGAGEPYQQCGTIGEPTTGELYEDRRLLDVLLVDCAALPQATGNFPVPASAIIGSVKVFVVDEWKFSQGSNGSHDLYVEIVGPGDDTQFNELLKKHWVELNESRNATK